MPSLRRLAFLRETVRNHPVIASTSAATGGVLLGAFVAVQLLATPKPSSDSAGAALASVETKSVPKPVAEIKPAPKPLAETTGSAPTGESVASADCDQQTWPHLSRVCMEEFRAKNRSTRVVTTDKLDKPTITAIETQPAVAPAPAAPMPPSSAKPAVPATVAVATPPAATEPRKPAPAPSPVVASATPAASAPVPAVAPAAPPQPVLLAPPTVQPAAVLPQPVVKEAKEKRVAKKTNWKPRADPKAPAKQDVDDDGGTFASADPDERAFEDRNSSGRGDRRSRRIVERWTERDYDVPDSRGGRRQVTVIRRNNGGGLFESLFGN